MVSRKLLFSGDGVGGGGARLGMGDGGRELTFGGANDVQIFGL